MSWRTVAAEIVLFRGYRLGGRIKKRGGGEILVSTLDVLEHDVNGLRVGIDPGN